MANPSSPKALRPVVFAIPLLVSYCLWLFGANLLLDGTIGLVGCVLMLFVKVGIEFKADHRAFREYYSVVGKRFGSWQPLPPIVGVTVKYFSDIIVSPRKESWNDRVSERNEKLVVMLSVENEPIGIIIGSFSLDDVNPAIDFAHDIAEEFGVPVHVFLPENQFRPL